MLFQAKLVQMLCPGGGIIYLIDITAYSWVPLTSSQVTCSHESAGLVPAPLASMAAVR